MQRDGNSDDRSKAGASGRTPPVIEGEAVEMATPGERPAETELAAEAEPTGVEEAQAEASGASEELLAPPKKKSRGGALAVLGVILVACAGAVAWIATPGQNKPGDGSLKSRVIALLPDSAQRALHVSSAIETKSGAAPTDKPLPTEAKPAAPVVPPQSEVARVEPPKTEAAKPESAKPEEPKAEAPKPVAAEPKPADKPAASSETNNTPPPSAPAPSQQGMTMIGGPPVAIGVDPKRIEDMSVKIDGVQAKVDALQGKLDAALGRIADLQSKLELAQGKIDLSQSKAEAAAGADALTQAAQRIEALTQKLAAIEQKLEQPKTDTRAPQARENSGAPSGRELAASRAVVAQATTEALRAGAPLGDDLAALKGLGVVDDKLADLNAYSKSGAPTVAQLTQQWRGLRDKVIALDAPAPGASFTDKLAAKAKSVFHVTWAGQGAQNSIGSVAARVDASLAKNDLAGAVAACDEFPAVAKNVVADWQKAASQRLKADAAARALLSESISAIGRSSSQ